MFTNETIRSITTAATRANVEPAALLAVAEVESGGKAFATVDGRPEPLIRFEGHYFDRRLSGEKRTVARAAGLSSPNAGGVANPSSQAARWALLRRAAAIDSKAAHESVSWGIGQVMGAHWDWLGYASVEAFVAEARASVEGQATQMMRFIEKAGLAGALRRRDWAAFARGYNGPAYARNAYDRKMAAAYAKYRDAARAGGGASPLLRRGARGDAVAELQRLLTAAGFAAAPDGIFGPATEAAVKRFQRARGLAADGIVGRMTWGALGE